MRLHSVLLRLSALGLLSAGRAEAQHEHASVAWSAHARGDLLVTRTAPAFDGETFTEGYLTLPTLMIRGRARDGRLQARITLSAERWTLDRGELTAGIWGEGYLDRRHPHTPLHELVGVIQERADAPRWSLALGKGFVAFGTDDPMTRPFTKFPANHHLAQLLERVVLTAGVRRGPVAVELSSFNGDEPASVRDQPNLERFADSWASRVTWHGPRRLEWQGSFADVGSPEDDAGFGARQHKWSSSVRLTSASSRRYLLAEWARTDLIDRGSAAFQWESLLAEASISPGPLTVALRAERTHRPEEERLRDPFRAPYPHREPSYLGLTRWDILSLHLRWDAAIMGPVAVRPFAEITRADARAERRPSLFEPELFYGSPRQWHLSLGLRLASKGASHQMGRYGISERSESHHAR